MAIVEVKVPQLSESVAEATMLQWKKKVGDAIAADEILIEIETDKVVLEVPAPAAGVLVEMVVADGGTVAAEQVIARIDTEGKAGAAVAPTATALPITPNMWNDWNRNISCMRNHEMISAFTKTIPKMMPTMAYFMLLKKIFILY